MQISWRKSRNPQAIPVSHLSSKQVLFWGACQILCRSTCISQRWKVRILRGSKDSASLGFWLHFLRSWEDIQVWTFRNRKGFHLKTWSSWIQQTHVYRYLGTSNSSLPRRTKEIVTTKKSRCTLSCLCSAIGNAMLAFPWKDVTHHLAQTDRQTCQDSDGKLSPIYHIMLGHWKLSALSNCTNKDRSDCMFSADCGLWATGTLHPPPSLGASRWCVHSRRRNVQTSTNWSRDHS